MPQPKRKNGNKTSNSWCFQIQLWSTADVKCDFQTLASLCHSFCLNCPESDNLLFTSHFFLDPKLSLYLLNHSSYSVVQAWKFKQLSTEQFFMSCSAHLNHSHAWGAIICYCQWNPNSSLWRRSGTAKEMEPKAVEDGKKFLKMCKNRKKMLWNIPLSLKTFPSLIQMTEIHSTRSELALTRLGMLLSSVQKLQLRHCGIQGTELKGSEEGAPWLGRKGN